MLSNQSFNIEQQNMAIQSMKDTKTTVQAMQMGLKEMKKEYKNIDLNKIENLQDDMADILEQANEVQDIMGRTYGMPEVFFLYEFSKLRRKFAYFLRKYFLIID